MVPSLLNLCLPLLPFISLRMSHSHRLPLPTPVSYVPVATLPLISFSLWPHPLPWLQLHMVMTLHMVSPKDSRGLLGDDRNILYFDCDGGYLSVYIYQYSPNVKLVNF